MRDHVLSTQAEFDGKKRVDAASYDLASAEFNHFSELFSEPLAMRMLDLARLQTSDETLDVGTGTGLVALRAARQVPKGRVTGIDHSSGMLAQASEKARHFGLENVSFRLMDAERLEFPDQSFDVVLSLYALFHFPDPLSAIREMYRVLRPGGRILIGVGAGPNLLSWNAIVQGAMRAVDVVAAARGRLLTAPHFLRRLMVEHGMVVEEGHVQKSRETSIPRMLRDAGFRSVYQRWQGHREMLEPDDFWRLQVTFASAERIRLQQATPDDVAKLKADFLNRCRGVVHNHGTLIYRYAAMFHVATRAPNPAAKIPETRP